MAYKISALSSASSSSSSPTALEDGVIISPKKDAIATIYIFCKTCHMSDTNFVT